MSQQSLELYPAAQDSNVVLISRQPIYDSGMGLFAYELLCGSGRDGPAQSPDPARPDVLLNVFLDAGLEILAGETRAFVTVSRDSLFREFWREVSPERVALEISWDVTPDETVLRRIAELKECRFAVALDAFSCGENSKAYLKLADYLTFDFARFTPAEIARQLAALGPAFKGGMLAKGLERHDQYDFARTAGFNYFRGSCFTLARPSKTARIPLNRLAALQLVIRLQEPELSSVELDQLVSNDLTISFKLLRYVNSAAIALPRSIKSIRHAIQLVGMRRIGAWASLLLLTQAENGPSELTSVALVRATMADRLARLLGAPNPESYFLVGLFSVVDALLNMPISEAIELLPLARPIREALVTRTGAMGAVLRCVVAYESGDWSDVECGNLPLAAIRQCYLDALTTARITRAVAKG